jgi:replicative DNA helicase
MTHIAHVSPEYGKQPPQAADLEQAVLGACLLERQAIRTVQGILEPGHLYVKAHVEIWGIIIALAEEGNPVDILTVTERAKAMGRLDAVGGPFYISQLANKVASSANVEYHARIIQQKYILRTLHKLGAELQRSEEGDDIFEVLDKANEMMAKVNAIPGHSDPSTAAEVMAEIADNRDKPVYIHMGLGSIDRHVKLGPGNICVIGARPSVGKTTFAVNAAMNMARSGHKVLFISMEMSKTELTSKIAGILTGIDTERITRAEHDERDREVIAAANVEHGSWLPRIMIEQSATLEAGQVAGIIARSVARHDVEVVILDYLQCITADGDSPVDRMTKISRACKSAAMATGVRLIELSQLKRRDGADTDPQMSDLREAGQIEADGDIIIMLGRAKGSSELLWKVEKNKVGPIGADTVNFDLPTQRIGPAWASPTAPTFNPRLPHPDNHIEPTGDFAPF